MRAFIKEIAITVLLALSLFFVLRFTIDTVIVIGMSMEPSFHNGQRILVSKVSYRFHEPERGDVIVFQPADKPEGDFIKRIIGIPGDTVEVQDGAVYLNGEKLQEPYIKNAPRYDFDEMEIPAGSYFVLGDNRNNSNDSHNGWVVPRENIVGKAWVSIWPPGEWGTAPNYPLSRQLSEYIYLPVAARYSDAVYLYNR
jgi:signal peptidase I